MAQLKMRADADHERMELDHKHVLAMKQTALGKRDVIKVSCINDKLVQLKALLRIGDQQQSELNGAIDGGSTSAAGLLGQLDSTAHEVHNLTEQAQACLGERELTKQESSIEVTRPVIPDDPTTINPTVISVEPPAYASPFD